VHVALVNESTVVTDAQAKRIAATLRKQAVDIAAAWDRKVPTVRYYASANTVPASSCPLIIFDSPDSPGALGYHDVTDKGQPYGKVFATYQGKPWPVLNGVTSVAAICSHEFAEMVGDPAAGWWSIYNAAGDLVALELSDPVQDCNYDIDGVSVSNFVLPAYFNPWDTTGPFDHLGALHAHAPALANGGYVIVEKSSGERQVYGDVPAWKQGGLRTTGRLTQAQVEEQAQVVEALWKRHRKSLVAIVGVVIGIVGQQVGLDSTLYVDLVLVATAAGVYATPNAPKA
jgi:hypothetical protein